MNHHKLKIWPEHYNNVANGTKTFEIRVNDRGYQKGDTVSLYYWDEKIAKIRSTRGHETPINLWEIEQTGWNDGVSSDKVRKSLYFKIGDVYQIDSERVVFSLLKDEDKDVIEKR